MTTPRNRPRATMADIASLVSVSEATVSRALRGSPDISPATIERVRHAARELGYVPNIAARNLARKASQTLGLLVPDVTDPVHGQIVAGFVRAAEGHGFTVIVQEGAREKSRRERALRTLIEHSALGIAICGATVDPYETAASMAPADTVFILPELEFERTGSGPLPFGLLTSDYVAGIRALVQHLLGLGISRFSYVNGPDIASNRIRRSALLTSLEEANLEPRIREYTGTYEAEGLRRISGLIAKERPEALICYDDLHALHLMNALVQHGISVPKDMVLTGFDDIVFARLFNPGLTTVTQQSEKLGELAATMLARASIDGEALEEILLPVSVAKRGSTISNS